MDPQCASCPLLFLLFPNAGFFFFFSLLSASCHFPIPNIPHLSSEPGSSLSALPHVSNRLQHSRWYFPPALASHSFSPHHPFRSLSCSPFCHIHNYKSSRRELTHTWPRSVVPAVSDNLSTSLKCGGEGGRDQLLLGLLRSPPPPAPFHISVCTLIQVPGNIWSILALRQKEANPGEGRKLSNMFCRVSE